MSTFGSLHSIWIKWCTMLELLCYSNLYLIDLEKMLAEQRKQRWGRPEAQELPLSSAENYKLRVNPAQAELIIPTTDFHLACLTPSFSLTPLNFTESLAAVGILCPTGRFKMWACASYWKSMDLIKTSWSHQEANTVTIMCIILYLYPPHKMSVL